MQYRKFGKTDFQVSALGFGCMRLPVINGESSKIDQPEAIKMIRRAADAGVNYFDTAYPYHNGNSETVTGLALQDGYRNRVKLATKSPIWAIHTAQDFDRILDEQLTKLKTDHIDYYLLHALDHNRFNNTVLKFDLLKRAEDAKKAGKIGHIGFSFHDNYQAFTEILNGYDHWEFCQLQFNYMDIDNQAGLKGVMDAYEKGLAVIVMEPLLGGKLAAPSNKILEIFKNAKIKRSAVEWALDYLWNMEAVSLLLSGMSNMDQLEQNLEYAERSSVGMFSGEDEKIIEDVIQTFKKVTAVGCTRCQYCMPCPSGVDIPRNFSLYNEAHMYDEANAKRDYKNFGNHTPDKLAKNCTACRACEGKCPQKLEISKLMKDVETYFA